MAFSLIDELANGIPMNLSKALPSGSVFAVVVIDIVIPLGFSTLSDWISGKIRRSDRLFRSSDQIGVSVGTLRNWEQGRRRPEDPVRAPLQVAARNSKAVSAALAS